MTNAQYGSSGFFSGDHRPRESITWLQARDFCTSRGLRLPTEAEWEYAARGPDALLFPWGNSWSASHAVWNRGSDAGTANVGSIPAGRSWVGADDMIGNVWEWTSSVYDEYPYNPDDGRERESDDGAILRALRGGSWGNTSTDVLRAAARSWNVASGDSFSLGVRCARSYE